MTRRVLHVADTIAGGLGSFLTTLLPLQLADGDIVALAAPALVGEEDGLEHWPWKAVARPNHRLASELRTLDRIVRAFEPDVIHLHNDKAGLVGRLLLRGQRPTVFQPHAWSFQAAPAWLTPVATGWERSAARWTHVVVCVSEGEYQLARSAQIGARCVLARNGVDLERFAPAGGDDRTAARNRLGMPLEAPLAVCVGRMHRQKNQHALLDAWPDVRERLPEAQLVLVGEGPDRSSLEERDAPGVSLPGPAPDVRPWLAAADVVVQPSAWEGMPLSVLEALATARSIVVSDVSGMRELVRSGAGAAVARHDQQSLVHEMIRRLRDRAFADGEGRVGRALVERHHDVRQQHATIARLYSEVLNGGH
jgi:glycosyltransferase involved in cell wall biosynthesis